MEKCLKPHTASQPAMLYFHCSALNIFCAPFFAGSHGKWARERDGERKRRKTTQKQNEEEKSIFIEKLWDFSCAFYPPPTRFYLWEPTLRRWQSGGTKHTQSYSFLHFIRLSSPLHGFFHFKFSECHCTGSCDWLLHWFHFILTCVWPPSSSSWLYLLWKCKRCDRILKMKAIK